MHWCSSEFPCKQQGGFRASVAVFWLYLVLGLGVDVADGGVGVEGGV